MFEAQKIGLANFIELDSTTASGSTTITGLDAGKYRLICEIWSGDGPAQITPEDIVGSVQFILKNKLATLGFFMPSGVSTGPDGSEVLVIFADVCFGDSIIASMSHLTGGYGHLLRIIEQRLP